MKLSELIKTTAPRKQKVRSSTWLSGYLFIWYYPRKLEHIQLSIPPDFSNLKYEINIYRDGVSLGIEDNPTVLPFDITEEQFFQASLLNDFGDFDIECIDACKYVYEQTKLMIEFV